MIDQIRPGQLAQWLQSMRAHGEPVVLDVREPHELQMASVSADGFTLLTIPMGAIPPRLNELDPSNPLPACATTVHAACKWLLFCKSHGFEHVANIAGGIHAWSAELDPRFLCTDHRYSSSPSFLDPKSSP